MTSLTRSPAATSRSSSDCKRRTSEAGGWTLSVAPTANLRLFVAIELPDEVRAALDATAAALRRAGAGDALRWVRVEGIHVTLKFLGATPAATLPNVTSALEAALSGVPSLGLRAEGVGSFGGRFNLRVVWVGVGGDTAALAALAALAGHVEQALARLGFAAERRPFAAHLTLARVRDGTPPAERERIADLLAGFRPPPLPAFRADRVSLMESVLGQGGASYRALAVFPLQ